MMSLKIITVDFWNTLFDSSNGTARNNHRIDTLKFEISKTGNNISDLEYEKTMEESWEHFNAIWKNEQRTPTSEESRSFFWNRLNIPRDDEAASRIEKAFAESILYYPPKLIDGVADALSELSEYCMLAIVSDTGFSPGKVLRRLMHENDVLKYFSSFSFSDETEVAKPHPKAFRTVLDDLKVLPDAAMHIGDIEDTDIKGAKGIGMKAIRFSGDPTAFLNLNNSKTTLADYESKSWNDIVNYIKREF